MRCWRRTEISWTDLWEMKYYTVKEDRNILHTINRRKVNWICHILRRNCLLKYITEGTIQARIEVTRLRTRRRKQLFKETKGYWKPKQEALDHSVWRACWRRRYGPVVRHIRKWINGWITFFDVSLTVHLSIDNDYLNAHIFNTFITILYMYMFRAKSCSSSRGQIVLIQHLVSSLVVSDRQVLTNLVHKF